MSQDLRELSISIVGQLKELADVYPMRSPGRHALKRAARQVKLAYITTAPEKKQLIYKAIELGNTRPEDIRLVTGLQKIEVRELLIEMVDAEILSEVFENPTDDGRGGRKILRFRITDSVIENAKITA